MNNTKELTVKEALSYLARRVGILSDNATDMDTHTKLARIEAEIGLLYQSIPVDETLDEESPFMQMDRDLTDTDIEYIDSLLSQGDFKQYQSELMKFAKEKDKLI